MQRLSAVDALFVEMETKQMNNSVVAVLVLDPSQMPDGYSYEQVRQHFADRLDEIPAYRRRLVHVPFDLALPLWVDDPDFRLDAHIHRAGLPSPGGQAELAEFVADVAGRPLDRDRPLWETWVVEGLEDGNIAMVAKTHHSLMDGVTGADLISKLFDVTPEPRPAEPAEIWAPPLLPSPARLLVEALPGALLQPATLVRASVRAARGAFGFARGTLFRPPDGPAPTLPFTAPDTVFNGSICGQRTVAYGTAALADLKLIKNAYGCTVNDVVLTACGMAMREWLRDHGGVPDKPLLATLPVSVHESEKVSGNKVSAMFVRLPTTETDPILALRSVQEDTKGAKDLHRAMGAETIMELAEFAPRRLLNLAARLYSGWHLANMHRPVYNVIVSNVPGPPMPLYMRGARLIAFYPHGPVFEGAGLNITVMSYQDRVDIGVIGCRESVEDAPQITESFAAAIARLKAAAEAESAASENGPRGTRQRRSRAGRTP
jgi:diacylglycerol O-acyltransferase / wax synthase